MENSTNQNLQFKNCVKILEYAIQNKLSLQKSCEHFKFSKNYFASVKKKVKRKILKFSNEEKAKFSSLVLEYEKLMSNNIQEIQIYQEEKTVKPNQNEFIVTSTIDIDQPIKTIEGLIKNSNIDLTKFELNNPTVKTWSSPTKDNSFRQFYSVGLTLKKRESYFNFDEFKKSILNDLAKTKFVQFEPSKYETKKTDKKYLLYLNPADLHFNKKCVNEISNDTYNIEIAQQRFEGYINENIQKLTNQKIDVEKICLILGNDFFNSDNLIAQTTKGTPQDDDTFGEVAFERAKNMVIENILKLEKIAPISVIVVRGNHDTNITYFLGSLLESLFKNHPNIQIDNKPTFLKSFKYGQNIIYNTHGDTGNISQMPQKVLSKIQDDFHSQDLRKCNIEIHLGHIHTKRKMNEDEFNGISVEYLPSMSGTDKWHEKSWYFGNKKSAISKLYSFDGSDIQQWQYISKT